ncbi:MAG: hypothetical protein M3449_09970 [Acidobacteriota bacterium]|nr:hypothetical protein [Acidobacteriota bacterium]
MNGNCFEIGTIQAFLDGETAPDLSLKITNHAAACEACAHLLAEAEDESSVVFSILEREFDSLVPTQRLWSRINESIAVEKSHNPFWQKITFALSALIANPSLAVAASVLILFSMFAAVWNLRPDTANDGNREMAAAASIQRTEQPATLGIISNERENMPQASAAEVYSVKETNISSDKLRKLVTDVSYKEAKSQTRPQFTAVRSSPASVAEYLPGEESYVKTISDLKQNLDGQKDNILNPSSRVAYERDMAVVNDAITKMKEVVRKNPKNQSAKQVLYASYQNKIDLLNSVAEREELMASLK